VRFKLQPEDQDRHVGAQHVVRRAEVPRSLAGIRIDRAAAELGRLYADVLATREAR